MTRLAGFFVPVLAAKLALASSAISATPAQDAEFRAGAARVDITPDGPIRLSGYGSRRDEAVEQAASLSARALALDDGSGPPLVLVSFDQTGVPRWMSEALAERLHASHGIPRERVVVSCTHSHTAPCLPGMLRTLFGVEVSAEHQAHIEAYGDFVLSRLVEVCERALASTEPVTLHFARGQVGFAANRRTAGGPVDHGLPLLTAVRADGSLLATVVDYACHCTTLGGDFNRFHGDWAGVAAETMERESPGSVGLVMIGCGADANPAPRGTLEMAVQHGQAVAKEVARLLDGPQVELHAPLRARFQEIALRYDTLPTRAEWEARAQRPDAIGFHARAQLRRLDAGETLPTELAYPVQTVCFGSDLAMVFLGGEVVVDYSLRLARELDPHRLWVTSYTNDVPCYIPSVRVLKEGGYEAEGAMTYYDRPARLRPEVEDQIVATVQSLLPEEFLRPRPPSPEQARAAIETRDGLVVELVACEPAVVDPVALDFDVDGSLWVVEMCDYPYGFDPASPDAMPSGRIRHLHDRDGDGRFESSSVFLDGLTLPTGVKAFRRGILVCAAPDVLYAEDTDGDDRADVREVVLEGFATHNHQARVNSLHPDLDGSFTGAGGRFGGDLSRPGDPHAVSARDQDFRFDPGTFAVSAEVGRSQQGRDRDDFGEWFGCDNSTLAWHYPLSQSLLAQNPALRPPPLALPVAVDEDPGRLFPASLPAERFNDFDALGRVTSACGLCVLRHPLLEGAGVAHVGDLFTCEPVHNLVRHLPLVRDGVHYESVRDAAEQDHEFLASRDPWFRPVEVRTGPDGGLWICDMTRFVVEHPRWIPPSRLEHLDVRAGENAGRIFRVVPRGTEERAFDRSGDTAADWARSVETGGGWQRDSAARVLCGDRAPADRAARDSAIAEARPILERVAKEAARPESRVQALWILERTGPSDAGRLAAAAADPDPRVRANAARLVGRASSADWNRTPLPTLLEDADALVRRAAMEALAEARGPGIGRALASRFLADREDPFLRATLLAVLPGHYAEFVDALPPRTLRSADRTELFEQAARLEEWDALASLFASLRSDRSDDLLLGGELGPLLSVLESLGIETESATFSSHARLRDEWRALESRFARASEIALDATRPAEERSRALELLGHSRRAEFAPALAELLDVHEAEILQESALAALSRLDPPAFPARLASRWRATSPTLHTRALALVEQRAEWLGVWFQLATKDRELVAGIDPSRRARWLAHPEAAVAGLAAQALGTVANEERAAVLARYASADALPGNPVRGRSLFREHCVRCHRFQGEGQAIGPDLDALTDRSAESLRIAVLDPDRAVLDAQRLYNAFLRDGRLVQGMLAEESATQIVLLDADGEHHSILRSDVEELRASTHSLMPTGFEDALAPEDLADLRAHLQHSRPRRSFPGNRPATCTLELTTEGPHATLPATACEIYGSSIVFEEPFQNLGYWHEPGDEAIWTLEVPERCTVAVHLDYACADDAAGGLLVLEIDGETRATARVRSTGAWSVYQDWKLTDCVLEPGTHRLAVRPAEDPPSALLDLRSVVLLPASE